MGDAGDAGGSNEGLKTAAKAVAGVVVAGGVGYLIYKTFSQSKPSESSLQESRKEALNTNAAGSSSSSSALKNEGNAQFKAGHYEEAIQLYTQAIEACTNDSTRSDEAATYYQNRAAAHEKLNHWEQVIEDCSIALRKNPKYVKAYIRRAKAYERCMKYQEALHDFTAACILEQFQHYPTMEGADRVLKSLSEEKAKISLKERGNASIPLSVTFVESYLASFCEDPVLNAVHPRGVMNGDGPRPASDLDEVLNRLANKNYDDIASACTAVIDGDGPSVLEARLIRATFSLIQGNSEKATEDFASLFESLYKITESTHRIKKIKANAFVKRGSFHMQQGRKEECLEDFAAAENVDPENADIYHHRGQLLILMNEIEKAKADFEKCISLRPDFSVARVQACYANYRHAVMSDSMLNTNNSILAFENVVSDFPDCAEGFALLGQVYVERQAFADAEQMFDKALNLAPNNANIHVHKGLLALSRSEDFEKARECIRKALKVDPYSEFAYETLGTIEVQRGKIKDAVNSFDEALSLARTELELVHLFSLREAAMAQVHVAKSLGIDLPGVDDL